MDLQGSTVLITGANRGLGSALVTELLSRGVAKIYAGARKIESVTNADPRVVPVRLDVTDEASVHAAAERATDVDIVINNAGVAGRGGSLLTGDAAGARIEMETNFWGSVGVLRAFAPILAGNGGGTAVNVLSVLSFLAGPGTGGYSASKAAAWSLSVSARAELRAQGTRVVAVHVGYMDTDMTTRITAPKLDPADIARQIADAIAGDVDEVLADDLSRQAKHALSDAAAGLEVAAG